MAARRCLLEAEIRDAAAAGGIADCVVSSNERTLSIVMMDELASTLTAGASAGQSMPVRTKSLLEDPTRITWIMNVVTHCAGIYRSLSSKTQIERRRALRKGALLMDDQPARFICVEFALNSFQFAGLSAIGADLNPAVTDPPSGIRVLIEGGRVHTEPTTNLMSRIMAWDPSLDIPARERHQVGDTVFESI
jgi:hypothetical protein